MPKRVTRDYEEMVAPSGKSPMNDSTKLDEKHASEAAVQRFVIGPLTEWIRLQMEGIRRSSPTDATIGAERAFDGNWGGIMHLTHADLKDGSRQTHFQAIAKRVCREHPSIDINDRIKGIPVIKGNRISVGQLLGRIYALESVDAVVEFYRSALSKEQVKEAIAFAQDFLETACEPI